MKNTHKILNIKDVKRWGLKYGEKRQWYYKMRLDFFNDPLIQGLNNHTKIVFLTIINESLRENKSQISMCLEFIKHQLRVELDVIKLSLRELKDNDIIELENGVRTQLIEEKKRKEKRIKQNKDSNESESEFLNEIVDLWNRNVDRYGMPRIKTITEKRRKLFTKASKDFNTFEDWQKIFNVACMKGFTKPNGEQFIPNWDYIFRNENYVKFREEADSTPIVEIDDPILNLMKQ